MGRIVLADSFNLRDVVKYGNDSVFNNGIAAAGATLESTDSFLLIPSSNPTLRIRWTTGPLESADFEIRIRLFDTPLDPAGPFAVLQVVFGLTAVAVAPGVNGSAYPLRENAMPAEIIYGYADVQIVNNDAVNSLQGIYAEILMERADR